MNLENKKAFKKYDKGQVLESIKLLSKQCRQAQREADKITLPAAYKQVKNIVICGMGGSSLASHLIGQLFAERLSVPFEIINDYQLPKYVDHDSLVFGISYSGQTEETIEAIKQAQTMKARILVITTGGQLAVLAKKFFWPSYVYKPVFNPSAQPRLGLGYSLISQIQILRNLNLLNISETELEKALKFLETSGDEFKETKKNNLAKRTAYKFLSKIPVIFSGNYFLGNAHIISNQINENAKNFACYFALPELNHHLLEGLRHPSLHSDFVFFLLKSRLDRPVIKKRFSVTEKILNKMKLPVFSINIKGENYLSQGLWLLVFGGFLSFYLAMLNKEDPSLIPWVNFFKKKLAVN
ncbi:MAG: SIS domain-containing protein [Patescibacteria group bacterium]